MGLAKAKRMYGLDDILSDDLEVAEFEINLEQSLTSIANDLRRNRYQLRPLTPLAHPKGMDDSHSHRIRQSFKVAVRDQVAWIALVNIIGPVIEKEMPSWSYGNRLYRQLFFEPGAEGNKHLRFGHFRHARGELYRPFHQAWPVYRRHILFTARKMTGDKIVLDERDDELLKMELKTERLDYLQNGWWQRSYPEAYWATIDFRQFYPNVHLDIVRSNLCRFYDNANDDIRKLVDQLLLFPLGECDWSDDVLKMIDMQKGQKRIKGIPTGLFVSGFLANVAMLQIDVLVQERLQKRQIAQFRYVDDHTVLASSHKELNRWLDDYLDMVRDVGLGADINEEKTEPIALRDYRIQLQGNREELGKLLVKATDATRIDIRMPTPLLTKTLAKVSMIANVEFDLQTIEEQDSLLADIEQLLLTEFPAEELRPDTRMSFAMSQLCKLAAKRFQNSQEIWIAEGKIATFIDSYSGKERPESSKLRSLQIARDLAIDRQFARLFEFLEMTLERYPDRPRLWAKAVRFCLWTGYAPGLKRLFDLLRNVGDLHPLSMQYMESFIVQRINRYFLQALSIILSPDRPLCQRSAAVRFANACYEIADTTHCAEREHSNVIRLYAECQNAYWLLSRCVRSRSRNAYDLEEAYFFLYQQGLLSTLPAAEKRIPKSVTKKQAEAAAHWHVDSKITPFIATRPSFYWIFLSSRLAPSHRADSFLLAKWPDFLRARARTHFLHHFRDIAPERLGWFADVLLSAPDSAASRETLAAKRLRLGSRDSKSHITLDEWVRFATSLNHWDPRRSEWTALEIVRHALAGRLSFSERDQKQVPLVPQNILVPVEWKDDPSKQPFHSWESWDRITSKSTPDIRLRSVRPVADDRYSPLWRISKTPPDPWEDVYSCGLVLLGLLRLSFALPCSWNPEGQIRLWSKGMGRILREVPCSSWTLAILQSTIMPRNRETFLLRSFDQARFCQDDDTVNDPPEIYNVDMLKDLVMQSQLILKKYRVTVQDHKPRQLIPLSLDQIGKTLFEDSTGVRN